MGRVVIFGHSDVTTRHSLFFNQLRDYVQNQLKNMVPILYMHGDIHRWIYSTNFLGQSSMVRLSLVGFSREVPLRVTVNSTIGVIMKPTDAFVYKR